MNFLENTIPYGKPPLFGKPSLSSPKARVKPSTTECPHHGVSNHELMKIFYDGLGSQDRYLLDAESGNTFMSNYEDKAMELIKTVAESSHHYAAKPFERGAMPKG